MILFASDKSVFNVLTKLTPERTLLGFCLTTFLCPNYTIKDNNAHVNMCVWWVFVYKILWEIFGFYGILFTFV